MSNIVKSLMRSKNKFIKRDIELFTSIETNEIKISDIEVFNDATLQTKSNKTFNRQGQEYDGEKLLNLPKDGNYWVVGEEYFKSSQAAFVPFYDKSGLDLHGTLKFTPNFFKFNPKPRLIIVHWGGLNTKNLYNIFSGDREASSHIAIGLNEKSKKGEVFQMLNLQHKPWHAKQANNVSIGIDICQQAETKWEDYYQKKGYNLKIIKNNSGRGPSRVLSLNTEILNTLSATILELSVIFNIPLQTPRTNNTTIDPNTFEGVVGHHHVQQGKWDPAPWWDDISKKAGLKKV